MKRIGFAFSLIILCVFNGYAQNEQEKFWDHLLNNDRESAFKVIHESDVTSNMKASICNEILRVERGRLKANAGFIDAFLKQPDFEYYLYALWNEPYIFDTYLESGITPKNTSHINKAFNTPTDNLTIKDALLYLKSVIDRHNNDWDSYFKLNAEINAITDWQYCGVFENLNESGLDKVYQPELKAQSAVPFDAGSNGPVNWYDANTEREPYQFFTNHGEYGAGVHYAQTFIETSQEKRVLLRIGNGSAFKVWLNDVLVFKNTEDATTDLNGYQVKLTIPKGVNRLLIKNAEKTQVSYFMASLIDDDQTKVEAFSYSSEYRPYNKSTLQAIDPEYVSNEFEDYFIKKREENPGDFFYDYCLINTYLRNQKFKEAKQVVLPIYEKYPKSSLLRKILIEIYNIEEDYTSINEIKENMEIDDEDYYLPLILKIVDSKELGRMSVGELEAFLDRFRSSVDLKIFDITADFYLNARKGDRNNLRKNLDDLIDEAEGNTRLLLRYAPIYASAYEQDNTTIKILERVNKNFFSTSARSSLSYYYDKQGKKDAAVKVFYKDLEHIENDNYYLGYIINKLHDYEKYDESMQYIDKALVNFPHSFTMLELKGDALLQLDQKAAAIKAYEESLKYNNAHASLRKKIQDLKNEENLLDDLLPLEVYDFIAENKGKITTNNYGYNILLDDGNIELFNEGGGKYRFVLAYEITSDSGVERFKEYNLGLSGNYNIIKSEIVKANGSVVPADRSGSNLVFNGLTIGDVIHIDYQNSFSNVGRFYKDYVDYFQFGSFHPVKHSSVQILVPESVTLNYKTINGDLEFSQKKKGAYTLYEWQLNDDPGMEQDERYMPATVDVSKGLFLSTIGSWNDIAMWYSDLVRSRIEINATVEQVFEELFPNGYKNLSETQRAETIYNYIMNNFSYSYVSFKQSGFVPQKPSKTISTALGDCKDFSTLFVTLGRMAELDTNLVLILTADNGQNALVLPSQDFNHCIAKVNLDGEEQYLELTDKYLPFQSLPQTLHKATALEIPYSTSNMSTTYDLFKLDEVSHAPTLFRSQVDVKVTDEHLKLNIDSEFTGHITSYYESVLADPNFEVVKKSIYDDFNNRIKEDFVLDDLRNIERIVTDKKVKFTTDITIESKRNKIGSIQILQLPVVSNPYTSGIISSEDRKYPIEYVQYENVDEYFSTYNLILEEGKTFVEIPESKTLTFKDHSYSITYTQEKPHLLKIDIHAKPSYKNIMPEDYNRFKDYVKAILEAEKEFIGYK